MAVANLKLVTGAQMAEIDRRTIASGGVSGSELMERAGRRVVEVVAEEWDGLENLDVVVVCGKGNNGGDGFVASRFLISNGSHVRTFLTGVPEQVQGDASHHLKLLTTRGGSVEPIVHDADLDVLKGAIEGADFVVDALLGIGFSGAPRGQIARVVEVVSAGERPVVSVDLPSGVDADTGNVPGACIKAAITVTFGLPKLGHMFFPGRDQCGVLRLVDIGFPEAVVEQVPASAEVCSSEWAADQIPRRPGDAHKGSCGSVAVVAGSTGMTGAACLTAQSALLAGCGRVTLGVPASINQIMEIKLTEAMTKPLPEVRKRGCLSLRAMGDVTAMLGKKDCLAVGPGVGRYRETVELMRRIIQESPLPIVADADGLNALAGAVDILKQRMHETILTPHLGEFARLTGLEIDAIATDPLVAASDFAVAFGVVLVLKGAPTIIALPDGRAVVNPSGNPGMATAGSGDVLTGTIAGFLAQGLGAGDAACLGVYIHGKAGDLARDEVGEWGLLAGDIARALPRAIVDTVPPF